MKERWVDIALISALVLIAATIVYTLVVPGSPTLQAGPTPEVPVEAVEPIPSNDPPNENVSAVPLDEPTTPSEPISEEQLETVTLETPPSGEPEPVVEEATPSASTPLPEGEIDLERVGFSFVTGGTGSCNIVLEPWQHVAVSLDLREQYPCGSEVTITLNEEVAGRTSFRAIVADSIRNAERTVNVYVGTDEPALEYGIKDGSLSQ